MNSKDIPKVKDLLSHHNHEEVNVYLTYLSKLESDKGKDGKKRNQWFAYFTPEQAADIYNKVAVDGLYIDGETITLQFKGSVMVSYNYQAYKNKLLSVYPETLFDIQNVYEGDKFNFRKDSGKVFYKHEFTDPFNPQRRWIGCYCIIKNKRGEFIETLNETEVKKMKGVAKTKAIWDTWFEEMTLKSVIKRACKRHFKDITSNIETIDNENNDLDLVKGTVVADSVIESVKSELENIDTIEGLGTYFKTNKTWQNNDEIIELFAARKADIEAGAAVEV